MDKKKNNIRIHLSFEEKATVMAYCKETGQSLQGFARLAVLDRMAREYRPKRAVPVSGAFPGISSYPADL